MNPVDLTASQLWLPGQGLVPPHMRAAMQAVTEYDPDLEIGKHEQSGEWVIMLKRGPEGRPFPVLGLGTELPAPEKIQERLFCSDARRRGREIVQQIVRKREIAEKEAKARASDAADAAAEALEWGHRQMGSHPSPRIFVPDKKET